MNYRCEDQGDYEDIASDDIVKPYSMHKGLCLKPYLSRRAGCQQVMASHIQRQAHHTQHEQSHHMDAQHTGYMS